MAHDETTSTDDSFREEYEIAHWEPSAARHPETFKVRDIGARRNDSDYDIALDE